MMAAWLTVAVLIVVGGCAPSAARSGVVAGLVLATCYGFLYVHSGRSGNSDSLFTLLVLLTVVTLWASRDHPWRRVWLGVVVGSVFMVKGMGILMPSLIIGCIELSGRWRDVRAGCRWRVPAGGVRPAGGALGRGAMAPRRVALLRRDVLPRTSPIASPWCSTGTRASRTTTSTSCRSITTTGCSPPPSPWRACPPVDARFARLVTGSTASSPCCIASWFAARSCCPPSVATKLGWYLNSFYPLFALGVAWLLVEAWQATRPCRAAPRSAGRLRGPGLRRGRGEAGVALVPAARPGPVGAEPVPGARLRDREPAGVCAAVAARGSLRGPKRRRALPTAPGVESFLAGATRTTCGSARRWRSRLAAVDHAAV